METAELIDPHHVRRDLRQLEGAIKRREFEISDAIYKTLANHMAQIVVNGTERGKTAAAKVLIALAEFNRTVNEPGQPKQTTINVGVNVENNTDSGRTLANQIAERIRIERVSEGDSQRVT
jgi:hypothetical protein